MKKLVQLIALIISVLILTIQNNNAQDFSSEIPRDLNEQCSQSDDVLIKTKMIHNFYCKYNEVEIVSWRQLLDKKSLDSTLVYIQAYRNINLNEIDASNLNTELGLSVQGRVYELNKERYRNYYYRCPN